MAFEDRLPFLGAAVTAMLASALYSAKLAHEVRALKASKARGLTVPGIARGMSVDPRIPVSTERGMLNAYYAPKESYWLQNRWNNLFGDKPTAEERLGERIGSVTFGPSFRKPAIIAHELGHASIGNEAWYSPSRVNQQYGRMLSLPLGIAGNMLSPVIGYGAVDSAVNAATNPTLRSALSSSLGKILVGAGAGALTGAITHAPVLLNEWQASARAKDYLNSPGVLSDDERSKSNSALNRAYGSYVLGSVLLPALAGGIGGSYQR